MGEPKLVEEPERPPHLAEPRRALTIMLPEKLIAELDKACGSQGRTRFIYAAIQHEIPRARREARKQARIEAAKPKPPPQFGKRSTP